MGNWDVRGCCVGDLDGLGRCMGNWDVRGCRVGDWDAKGCCVVAMRIGWSLERCERSTHQISQIKKTRVEEVELT